MPLLNYQSFSCIGVRPMWPLVGGPPSRRTKRWSSAGLSLNQRHRLWPNIKPTLGQCIVLPDSRCNHGNQLPTEPTDQTYIQHWFNVVPTSQTLAQRRCIVLYTENRVPHCVTVCTGWETFSQRCVNVSQTSKAWDLTGDHMATLANSKFLIF